MLTAREHRWLADGAGLVVSEARGRALDALRTVTATIDEGGLPTPQYERLRREREVWLWVDLDVSSLLQGALVDEVASELRRHGVPHRVYSFRGRPDRLTDLDGVTFDMSDVLAEPIGAVIVMLSDGRRWRKRGRIRPGMRRRLHEIEKGRRLAVVDVTRDERLAWLLSEARVTGLWPESMPEWLAKGRAKVPCPLSDAAMLQVWLGLVYRQDERDDVAVEQALELLHHVPLPGVRALHIAHLLGESSSPSSLRFNSETVKAAREAARRRFPRAWSAAAEWWIRAIRAESKTRTNADPEWVQSPAALAAAVDEAVLEVEELEDPERVTAHLEFLVTEAGRHQAALRRRFAEMEAVRVDLGQLTPQAQMQLDYLGFEAEELPRRPQRDRRAVAVLGLIAGTGLGALVFSAALFSGRFAAIDNPPPTEEAPKIEMVPLSGGVFCMGSPSDESGRYDNEAQLKVEVDAFAIATTETTRAQYEAWRTAGGSGGPSREGEDDLPATEVDWPSARAFCQSLGKGFDLPTEAEWAYAARGGKSSAYSFGDDAEKLGEYAWFEDNSGGRVHPVGQKRPNPVGLFDVHGNVDEWVLDRFESRPEPSIDRTHADPGLDERAEPSIDGARADPSLGERPAGAASDGYRVIRGGAYSYSPRVLRSAYRYGWPPGVQDGLQGFRCVGPSSLELEPLNP